jgi:serine/threonine protein kinase/Tol biopolymer transport system component
MLAPGTRLGVYEVIAAIGAGGMGEVYKGKDTRLDRIVAIKVLPSHVSDDPALRDRFEREARTVAALNHPHICTLHDVGRHEGTDYLVLEYLEGLTLAERLTKGALPLDQGLAIAIQIADALAVAHRAGIVHRDLKPGNIMLTKSRARLLDFGLAKVTPAVMGQSGLSMAPTGLTPVTMQGTLLGTLQYMAPEQIEGYEADTRTDIFAFGCLLHEMVTGQRAFQGKTQAALIAGILKDTPQSIDTLQGSIPSALTHVVERCLAKNADERWQSMFDVKSELQWIAAQPEPRIVNPSRSGHPWFALCAAAAGGAAAAAITVATIQPTPPVQRIEPIQFTIPTSGQPQTVGAMIPAVSPDGKWIAYTAPPRAESARGAIFVRALNSTDARQLDGTEDATGTLFWSPDSRYIAFFTGNRLKKIAVSGGPPQDVAETVGTRGGTWNADGTIVFSREGMLYRVAAAGGKAEALNDGASHSPLAGVFPTFLPDGRRFLYLSAAASNRGINVASLDGSGSIHVLDVFSRAEAVGDYLLYARDGVLLAQRFDTTSLNVSGDATPLGAQIAYLQSAGNAAFSVSQTGVFAYRTGGAAADYQFAWFDRTGKQLDAVGKPAPYSYSWDLAPSSKALVVSIDGDLWQVELTRGVATKITANDANDSDVIWSPDGTKIVFASDRLGRSDLFEKDMVTGAEEHLLLRTDESKFPEDWSHDGRYIAFVKPGGIDVLPLLNDRTPFPIVRGAANEPHFSFDGKWLAYDANESGGVEVYVASFPKGDRKRRISTNGGGQSRWRSDGKEIYYLAPDGSLMAVDIASAGESIEPGLPHTLFKTDLSFDPGHDQYAVTPDGQRFLIRVPLEASVPIKVSVNWMAALGTK